MAKTNKKPLSIGIFLALTFWGVLALIFSPLFGNGRSGLQFADDMFNKLAKGSSYFIPKVAKANEKFMGKQFAVAIKPEKPEHAKNALALLTKAGSRVQVVSSELKISGDLGSMLSTALKDADDMYKNEGKKVFKRYGIDEKEVMVGWWNVLKVMDKAFKKEGKIMEAKIVSDVGKKAVEPAYNFYKVEAQQVSEKAGIMSGLLVFYVAYTMWWGFAIFFLFEGMGLSMKKAKVKKEI